MKTLPLLLLVTACCTSPAVQKPSETPPPERKGGGDTVKPGAPTKLEAQVTSSGAKLALHFASAGKDVSVTISGIDGVTVTSPAEALTGAAVKAGEVIPLDVTFTGASGHLVVSVRGNFGGAVDARVHSVQIGDVQLQKDGSKILKTDDGDTVKVMP